MIKYPRPRPSLRAASFFPSHSLSLLLNLPNTLAMLLAKPSPVQPSFFFFSFSSSLTNVPRVPGSSQPFTSQLSCCCFQPDDATRTNRPTTSILTSQRFITILYFLLSQLSFPLLRLFFISSSSKPILTTTYWIRMLQIKSCKLHSQSRKTKRIENIAGFGFFS